MPHIVPGPRDPAYVAMVWSSQTSKQIDKWENTRNEKCLEEYEQGHEESWGAVSARMGKESF